MAINKTLMVIFIGFTCGYVVGHTVHKIKVMQNKHVQIPIKLDMSCYEALSGDILCENGEYGCVWSQDTEYQHIMNVSCIKFGGKTHE